MENHESSKDESIPDISNNLCNCPSMEYRFIQDVDDYSVHWSLPRKFLACSVHIS